MYLNKDQEKVMNESFDYCEDTFETLLKKFKKDKEIQDLLVKNTFFAGGVFRSFFTGTPVNDVDIYFKNTEAISIFLDYMFSSTLSARNATETKRGTINFTDSPCSFITSVYGDPEAVLRTFDFTFNKHYYDAWTGDFSVNTGAFKKEGNVILGNNSEQTSAGCMNRAFRFLNEGFKIEQDDLLSLLQKVVHEEKSNGGDSVFEAVRAGTSSSEADNAINQLVADSYQETFSTIQIPEGSSRINQGQQRPMYNLGTHSFNPNTSLTDEAMASEIRRLHELDVQNRETAQQAYDAGVTNSPQPVSSGGYGSRPVAPNVQRLLDQQRQMQEEARNPRSLWYALSPQNAPNITSD